MRLDLILLGVLLLLLARSLRYVPPNHVAVVLLFGQRTSWVKREGLSFFPFFPFVFSGIIIDMRGQKESFNMETVRTGDKSELEIAGQVFWSPDPEHAIAYLNNEGILRARLVSDVQQALLDWLRTADLDDAFGRKDGKALGEAEDMATGVVQRVAQRETGRLTPTNLQMPSLGIIVTRLNVTLIRAKGAAQTELEFYPLGRLIQRLTSLLSISTEKATEIVQVESGKVEKRIHEVSPTIRPEVMKAAVDMIREFKAQRR